MLVGQHGILAPLEADRGEGVGRERAATDRARVVAWKHDHAVGQLEQACQRAVQDPRLARGVARDVEIRPADVANQQRVAGERKPRLARPPAEIRHQIRVMSRRVSGRGEGAHDRVAHLDLVAIGECVVLELHARVDRQISASAAAFHECRQARDVVGLDVRLEDRGDRRADRGRSLEVGVHQVGVRVDDSELRVREAAEQIAGARALVVQKWPQDHRFSSLCQAGTATGSPARRHSRTPTSSRRAARPRARRSLTASSAYTQ
jgi:hypothetical protein